jgi:hypothetical protein
MTPLSPGLLRAFFFFLIRELVTTFIKTRERWHGEYKGLEVIEIYLYKTNFHIINRYLPAHNVHLEF